VEHWTEYIGKEGNYVGKYDISDYSVIILTELLLFFCLSA